MGKKIPPFWQQLNKFFLYPLQQKIILYALGMVALSLLFFIPLVNIIVMIFVFSGIASYGFKIAALSSLGVFDIEDHSAADEENDWKVLPWKFVGVLFLQGMLLGFVLLTFPNQMHIVAPVGSLLISLLMPAVVMILIQKLSFWAALNPIEWVRAITGVGWSYVLLFGFIYLLGISSDVAIELLKETMPWWLLFPSLMLAFMYFYFVNMAMIGYTMYQYHQNLDFDILHDYEDNLPEPTSPREIARQRDAEVAELIQNGETQDALSQAQDWAQEAPDTLADQRRYHRVLRLAGKPETLQKHGRAYITLLLKQQSISEAIKVYKTCLEKTPDFALTSAVATVSLAKAAYRQQEHQLALQMLRGFDKRFVQHPLIPAAFALIVRILQQGLRQPQQAQMVFNSLQRLYPNDPNTQEAASVLQKR